MNAWVSRLCKSATSRDSNAEVRKPDANSDWNEWLHDLAPFNLALSGGRANGMPMLVDPRFRPLYPYGEVAYLRNATLARELWTKPE